MKRYMLLLCCAWMAVVAAEGQTLAQDDSTRIIGQALPPLVLLRLDSTEARLGSLRKANQPLVVLYFSPTCSHCQQQTEEITANMGLLKSVNFLLVSAYPLADLRSFEASYGIARFQNMALAHDPTAKLAVFYGLKALPGIFVYNKNGLLVQKFKTNATAAQIAAAAVAD
ncbi:MAG: hypothetical protein EAY75_02595 [Bacteroidetes bacterium]|nr:MAG: hypothetical protein EAY75_02595 [Bacteroidota bacterium]